jgi:hypothetical protein
MNATTELINPQRPPGAGNGRSATSNTRPPDSEPPIVGEMIDEIVPLIGVVPVAGPPVIYLAGPWVLLALTLTGPFLLLVTFALAAMSLVAVTAAILAPPYLLVRHLYKSWTRRRNPLTRVHRFRERRPISGTALTHRPGPRLIDGPASEAGPPCA